MTGNRKLWLGVGRSLECDACGRMLRLSLKDVLAFSPVLAGFVPLVRSGPSALALFSIAAAFAVYTALHQSWVPLVSAERQRPG